MKLKAIAILLFLAPVASWGQQACPVAAPLRFCTSTAPNVACVEWVAPTINTDGSEISAAQKPLVFQAYRRNASGQYVSAGLPTQNLFARLTRQPLGLQCYVVVAIDATGKQSSPSCYACKTISFPGPTNGSIEAPSDGSIEDKK